MLDSFDKPLDAVSIKVIGIGGGGNNAVDRMIEDKLENVEYININTDTQSLIQTAAPVKISIGDKITHGRGAGSDPSIGKRSAEDSAEEIRKAIAGANMLFITAGMGGGTGTGAAPVVAQIAKNMGILTVAIVTKPFSFEGKRRIELAERGIETLAKSVDSLIVIPNERLKLLSNKKVSFLNAFEEADNILRNGVKSISELITQDGYINLDFADIAAVMTDAGYAHMGIGSSRGRDKAEAAAHIAMSSPILETSINGARGIIVNITSSPDIALDEIEQAASIITGEAAENATVIFGTVFDTSLTDEMKITLIATGFGSASSQMNQEQDSVNPLPQSVIGEKKPVDVNPPKTHEDEISNIIELLNKNR